MASSTSPIYKLPTELCWHIVEYLGQSNVLNFALTSKCAFSQCENFIKKAQEDDKSRTILEWQPNEGDGRILRRPMSWYSGCQSLERFNTLVKASKAGDTSKVRELLKDVSPNPPISRGSDPGQYESSWVTPLEAAMQNNHHEIINLLLDVGADVRYSEDNSQFGRLFFMPTTEESTIRVLLRHPRTQGINWHRGNTAKWACFRREDISIISKLINVGLWSDQTEYPTPVGKALSGPCNVTPSAALADRARHDVRRLLLSDEQRRNSVCSEQGYYPIHLAARHGYVETVRMLVQEYGVDPNLGAANSAKHVPLYYAVLHGVADDPEQGLKTIDALLECGASPAEYPDCLDYAMDRLPCALPSLLDAWLSKSGHSHRPRLLLIVAARLGRVPLIEQLLPLCEDDNDPDFVYENPRMEALRTAVTYGQGDAAKYLMHRTSYREAQLTRFDWALPDACRYCEESTVRALLQRCDQLMEWQWVVVIEEAARYQPVSILKMALNRYVGPISWDVARDILKAIAQSGNTPALCLFLQHVWPKHAEIWDWHGSKAILYYVPMMAAIEKGHLGIVETLLKWDSNLASLDIRQCVSAITIAVAHGHQEVALALFAALEPSCLATDPTSILNLENLPMLHAAQLGQAEVLAQLFARGCQIHYSNTPRQRTLLSWAAGNGHADAVRVLLANGADIHSVDIMGRTALHWAAAQGQAETARVLLEAGAQVYAFDHSSTTPYLLAISNGLEVKRDAQYQWGTGKTLEELEPIIKRRLDVARVLLEYNTPIGNVCGVSGYLYSLEQDIPQIIMFHIRMGLIKLDEMNEGHQTLLMLAVEHRAYKVAQLLLSMGCDVSKGYGKGSTPLELAEDDRMIKVLYSHM
ncbi:ankyrin repeat-containing domain protein [Aspergillus stella-maris]|uniref:ankyrin repeat-containing domain protein n=1 Tax=Aspergillus stella-maris TaxID=1810926 RepID=UPI003CCE0E70